MLALAFGKYMGKYLASGSEDQSIIVWDVIRHEIKYATLRGHSGPITSLAFIYWKLASGSLDGTIRLWEVSKGEMLRTFSASGMGGVYSVASFKSQDCHILSGSEDGTIRMWDTKHRDIPPKKFVGHTGKINSLSVAYTGRRRCFASGSSDETI